LVLFGFPIERKWGPVWMGGGPKNRHLGPAGGRFFTCVRGLTPGRAKPPLAVWQKGGLLAPSDFGGGDKIFFRQGPPGNQQKRRGANASKAVGQKNVPTWSVPIHSPHVLLVDLLVFRPVLAGCLAEIQSDGLLVTAGHGILKKKIGEPNGVHQGWQNPWEILGGKVGVRQGENPCLNINVYMLLIKGPCHGVGGGGEGWRDGSLSFSLGRGGGVPFCPGRFSAELR